MATSVAASQARVLAGVLVGCGIAAAPLAFKFVRDTENRVAAMRDASYAKDDAREARLQIRRREANEPVR